MAPTAVEELDLEQLLALEVQSVFGASKFLQKTTEAPAAVTVVTADDIRRFGYRTLADLLARVRGLHTSYDRTYAFVGVRGFLRPGDYNTRLLVLVDGFRVNDNVYDQAPLGEEFFVPLDLIERVEIVRGPGSSLYGSNAFFAVVNVITKRGSQVAAAEASVSAGTLGYLASNVRVGHVFANGADLVAGATVSDLDGVDALYFPELDAPDLDNGIAQGLDWEQRRSVFATLRYSGLLVQAAYTQRTKGVPTGAYGSVFNDPRATVRDRYGLLNVSYARRIGGLDWQSRAFLADMDYRGELPYAGADGAIALNRDDSTGRYWGTESLLTGTWRGRHRLTAGMEVRDNFDQRFANADVDPPFTYLDDRFSSVTWAWFAQDEVRLSTHHLINVGVRKDYYANFDAPVMPRLAWIVTPREGTALKVLFGNAFRAPNAYETSYAYGPYKADGTLRPERMRTAELSIEKQLGRRLRASAGGFRYWVEDLITQGVDAADGLLLYRNVGDATGLGAEFEVEGRWHGGASARASLTVQRLEDAQSSDIPANAPRHVSQVAVKWPLIGDRVLAGFDVQAVGARTTKSGRSLPAFAVSNLTVSVPSLARRLSVDLSVYNLFDRRYHDPAADELPQDAIEQDGRSLRVRCSWRF